MKQVQTIYCDDIRQEIGGKLTYVGVYSGSLLTAAFPVALPKFCVAVTVVVDSFDPLEPLKLRILKDDEVLAEREFAASELLELAPSAESAAADAAGDRVQIVNSFFMFTPFQVDTPCVLRVRVMLGNEELRGVGLRIEQMPAAA
jgi:hypothetical protein